MEITSDRVTLLEEIAPYAPRIRHAGTCSGIGGRQDRNFRIMTAALATPGNRAADMPHGIPFGEAVRIWTRIALLSFGGPAGQIAVMHRILVDEKKWIGEERFLHALNFCMLLPGPEAQQLAIYIGWLLHRVKGGLVAGILFVLPGALSIMALSWAYVLLGKIAPVAALFFGLKAAVVAIVFQAVLRIGSRALANRTRWIIAATSFGSLFFLKAPFPLVVLAAGIVGWNAHRLGVRAFQGGGHGHAKAGSLRDEDSALGAEIPDHARSGFGSIIGVSAMLLAAWLLPLLAVIAFAPANSAFADVGTFFARMAMLTFGGAYAVLAWVGQAAVDHYHWLTPPEMLDGLGLAESTPGPLIMVTQYVGFLATYRQPGMLSPLLAGTLGGLLTTWVTFVPCFLWIFAGAPFIERLRTNRALAASLSAITAAVVGVILNLALWFALHYWFTDVGEHRLGPLTFPAPDFATIDWFALLLSFAALIAITRLGLGTFAILGSCAFVGLARLLAG